MTINRRLQCIAPFLLAGVYLLIVQETMGIRLDHLVLVGFILACDFAHPKSRGFIRAVLPMAFFGILYDFLRAYPKEWAGPVHVAWPYLLEKKIFGIPWNGDHLILCEFFRDHTLLLLDLLTAGAYTLHAVGSVLFAVLLWRRSPETTPRFAWTFFLVNVMAIATYILLPVAPPWYVEQHGFQPASWSVPPSAAGLLRVDQWLGISYFQKLYSENAWVFGAIPSMHAGYPLLILLFARRAFRRVLPLFWFYLVLVWFGAVYLGHHYVIDLIAGVLYVLAAYKMVPEALEKKP